MNGKLPVSTDTGPIALLTSPPVEQLAEVLLTELVRTLTTEARPATVLGGRPHLRLFGEAIDLALPLRALRRLCEAAPTPPLELDDATLQRHGRAIADPDGYLVSPAGLYAALGRGEGRDAGVPADAMSLRLHTSPFARPMNALLRADPSRPETWLRVVEGLRHASALVGADRERSASHPCARRMARLRESLDGLDRIDDPRLPRLLGEQLVHAFMTVRALLRQRRVSGDDERRLRLCCALPDAVLADLRWMATSDDGRAWRDPGMLSTSLGHRWSLERDEPDALEIRPRVHGSAGRWLDGTVDDVAGPEPLVLFPPGTPFEVVEVVEVPAREDERSRVLAQLVELPSRRAASAWTTR